MLPRDIQSVKFCGCALRVRLIRQPLDDEPEPAASGRQGIENVDVVGKSSRSGIHRKEPVARDGSFQDELSTG